MTKEEIITAIKAHGYKVDEEYVHVTPRIDFIDEFRETDEAYSSTPHPDAMELYIQLHHDTFSEGVGYIGIVLDVDASDYRDLNACIERFEISEVGFSDIATKSDLEELLDELPQPDKDGYITYHDKSSVTF